MYMTCISIKTRWNMYIYLHIYMCILTKENDWLKLPLNYVQLKMSLVLNFKNMVWQSQFQITFRWWLCLATVWSSNFWALRRQVQIQDCFRWVHHRHGVNYYLKTWRTENILEYYLIKHGFLEGGRFLFFLWYSSFCLCSFF